MLFLVREQPDAQVLRHKVFPIRGLNDLFVVGTRLLLSVNHCLDYTHDISRVAGRLNLLAKLDGSGTGHESAQLLNTLSELLGGVF